MAARRAPGHDTAASVTRAMWRRRPGGWYTKNPGGIGNCHMEPEDGLEPEDGRLWVLGIGDNAIMAFTRDGIDTLR